MLIAGRAIAGVGAALVFAGTLYFVIELVPLNKRALYVAALTSVFGICAIIGPILGGVLTERLSWRW
jgi:MFS family permease